MKTHSHYTTPITLMPWVRRYRVALGASLALVATIIGLLYVLGFSASTPRPAADRALRTPTQQLMATCRACRDEALAAQIKVAAQLDRVVRVVHTTTHARIVTCRPCRDEALGANQASLRTADGGTVFSQLDDRRGPGPR
jgi:hypothetical protein